jgi:hypothetical protein
VRLYRSVVIACLSLIAASHVSACSKDDGARNPDGHQDEKREDPAAFEARLRNVSLASVVAAVAGTTSHEAPVVLEQWLAREPNAATMLKDWPRGPDGALDLDRSPVTAQLVDGTIAPGSKSRCGEVRVVFRGAAGPSLRLRLPIPATSHACRSARNGAPLHDGEALDALHEAIAAGIVPDLPKAKTLSIGGGPRDGLVPRAESSFQNRSVSNGPVVVLDHEFVGAEFVSAAGCHETFG